MYSIEEIIMNDFPTIVAKHETHFTCPICGEYTATQPICCLCLPITELDTKEN